MDRLTSDEVEAMRQRIRSLEETPAVFVSAHEQRTLDALRETLRARLQARLAHVRVSVPVADGEAIAAVYREAEVTGRQDDDAMVLLTARVPASLLGRLTGRKGVIVEDVA
jgi:50S ribosomal subunit-associated GTPase HflX